MSAPKTVTAKQIKKAIAQYEDAFVLIMAATNGAVRTSTGTVHDAAYQTREDALMLFRHINDLFDALAEQERKP